MVAMNDEVQLQAKEGLALAARIQDDLKKVYAAFSESLPGPANLSPAETRVYDALFLISPKLGNSYRQVKNDISSANRLSFAGSAHEVRELVGTLLRLKAPDEKVTAQAWFKQEAGTTGPTQRQRVRFILEAHGAGSKEIEVAQEVSALDSLIADSVRAMYSRASDAAHRHKDRGEVVRLVRYFDVFVEDLLDLD